jgi:hypothetical protein
VLCGALSVTQFGGSLASPGWGDVALWFDAVRGIRECDLYERSPSLGERFSFLEDAIPAGPLADVRRAAGTFVTHSDLAERDPRRPWHDVTDLWRARRASVRRDPVRRRRYWSG